MRKNEQEKKTSLNDIHAPLVGFLENINCKLDIVYFCNSHGKLNEAGRIAEIAMRLNEKINSSECVILPDGSVTMKIGSIPTKDMKKKQTDITTAMDITHSMGIHPIMFTRL